MNIYLAARYNRRLELSSYRHHLETLGHTVTSRWLNGFHETFDATMPYHMAGVWALEDYDDIVSAQLVLVFTETPDSGYSRGGRHVETGIAYALGKEIGVIGPRENVFHCLPGITAYASFDAFLAVFQELPICL